ncbi:unnamed protein product [Musa textilis]
MNYNFLSGNTNLLVNDRCSSEIHSLFIISHIMRYDCQIPLPGWAHSIKQQTDATVFERDVFRCKFFLPTKAWKIYPKYGHTVLSPNKAYWQAGCGAYSVVSRARLSC